MRNNNVVFRLQWFLAGLLLLVSLGGCVTAADIGTSIAVSSGLMNERQARSLAEAATGIAKAFTDITPEQEYYIGRAVAATVVADYRPYDAPRANRYLNLVGQTLARASDRPETFGGYRFLLVDSDEINAFAAPGGLIFVSRGLIRCCRSEDAVAAVLAHEIGHVQLKHGLQAIQKHNLNAALANIALAGARELGGPELGELTQLFESSVKDVAVTLMNNGYSRDFERQADAASVTLLQRLGYDQYALIDMLTVMEKQLPPKGPGFAATHPSPAERMAEIDKDLKEVKRAPASVARQRRFESAMRGV